MQELSAIEGRTDDAVAALVHPVLNLRGDELEAMDLTQVPDEFRSLDAKLTRALEAMCNKHGGQKNGTFYHTLSQGTERYHAERGSLMPRQVILRKVCMLSKSTISIRTPAC